jgi:hypothetical protein
VYHSHLRLCTICLIYVVFVIQVPHELEQIEGHFHKEECLINAKYEGKMQCLQIYKAQDENLPAVLQLKKRMQKQRKRKYGSVGDAGDAALPWYSRSNFQSNKDSSDESGSSSSEPDGDEIDYESQSLEESSEGSLVEFVVPDTDFN